LSQTYRAAKLQLIVFTACGLKSQRGVLAWFAFRFLSWVKSTSSQSGGKCSMEAFTPSAIIEPVQPGLRWLKTSS
jgi:hypothetical protein